MPTIFKIINREKHISHGRFGFIFPKYLSFILSHMFWLCFILVSFCNLNQSCSTKQIVSKLKDLQPAQEITVDNNKTNTENINYPIQMEGEILVNDNYTFETFLILISLVFLFSYYNNKYLTSLLSFFKKK
jgi:hypothetical protein